MPRYTAVEFDHSQQDQVGILLINLGTPSAPTAAAVRPYLKEFLSDSRVVEIPKPVWQIILRGIILPFRSGRSAEAYQRVWTETGSPLMVHSQALRDGLAERLADDSYRVELAMSYGDPSIPNALQRLRAAGCQKILCIPLYPQYSATTSAAAFDAVSRELQRWRRVPELHWLYGYHDHHLYVQALAASLRAHWQQYGHADRLLISFHGIPKRSLLLGDPYHCHCHATARLLLQEVQAELDAAGQSSALSFQSRFGKAEWLQPYTTVTLDEWAKDGCKTVDVICPGFATDCLETLDEIAFEAQQEFIAAGGQALRYIPALNATDAHLSLMQAIVADHTGNWLNALNNAQATRSQRQQAATALGAQQ